MYELIKPPYKIKPNRSIVGVEVFKTLLQIDARNITFMDEFDLVSAFDVLGHIENDVDVLHAMSQTLHPGGENCYRFPNTSSSGATSTKLLITSVGIEETSWNKNVGWRVFKSDVRSHSFVLCWRR